MLVIGSIKDTDTHANDIGPPVEAGVIYELHECPKCARKVLVAGDWHDMMDDEEEWVPRVVLPEERDRPARELLEARDLDVECMRLAIAEARKCTSENGKVSPKVGAVVARHGSAPIAAFRGERSPGDHAEYTLLEDKCEHDVLAGSTVYTTLEPCTTRNSPKIPCASRLIARKVGRVVIGMLDPDERIRGLGILALRRANIRVDLFPPDLMTELEELNRDFISSKENHPVSPAVTSRAAAGDSSRFPASEA